MVAIRSGRDHGRDHCHQALAYLVTGHTTDGQLCAPSKGCPRDAVWANNDEQRVDVDHRSVCNLCMAQDDPTVSP